MNKVKERGRIMSRLNKQQIEMSETTIIKMGLDSGQAVCIHFDVPSRR